MKNHLSPCLDKNAGISLSLLKSPLPKCRMSMCLSSFPFLASKTKRSSGQATTGFFLLLCVCVYSQSLNRLPLCDATDYRPRGSSVHGIFQARILEWVAISYSRGSSQPRDQTHISCISLFLLLHQKIFSVSSLFRAKVAIVLTGFSVIWEIKLSKSYMIPMISSRC